MKAKKNLGKLWGVFRYVPYARANWYLRRGWRAVTLGRYHSNFAIGMFKRAGK